MSTEEPEGRKAEKPSPGGLARSFEDLRARATRMRTGSPWLLRILAAGLVVTVIIPVFWVLVYGVIEAPGTLLMAKRSGEGETIRHTTRRLADISPHLVRAVIAAEDAQFCRHSGFDVEAIEKAAQYNERARKRGSDKRRGASTISQQTAKNLFLWPERSWVRKGLEVYFTFLIEALWSKKRIMEAYLNAAEWGDGVFGAEAAARARFGKSAKDLTAQEAARLAAVLPSPNKWNPVSPGPYVRGRARAIVARASVVRAEGYASCVLGRERVAPQKGRRKAPEPLPDIPPPPADLAPPEEGAPIDVNAPPLPDITPAEPPSADPAGMPPMPDPPLEEAPPSDAPADASPPATDPPPQ